MVPAPVLPVEIVGVLPNVEGKDRLEALLDRITGAGLLSYDKGAVFCCGEPDPAGAEERDAFGYEFGLEGFYGAPLGFDLGFEMPGRAGHDGGGGPELLEIHIVVEDLAGVVKEGAGGLCHDFFEGEVFEAAAGEELVEVVHVGLEVLAVVEAQGLGADDGLEGVNRIG